MGNIPVQTFIVMPVLARNSWNMLLLLASRYSGCGMSNRSVLTGSSNNIVNLKFVIHQ